MGNELNESEELKSISDDIDRIVNRINFLQANGLDFSKEEKEYNELSGQYALQLMRDNPEVINWFQEHLPKTEEEFNAPIQKYLDEEPELPYAKAKYYLETLLYEMEQLKQKPIDTAHMTDLILRTTDVITDYEHYERDKKNPNYKTGLSDFKDTLDENTYTPEQARLDCIEYCKILLQNLYWDSPENVEQMIYYNWALFNVARYTLWM